MRLLVTGRDGQVAQSLLSLAGRTVAVTALGRPDLDITDAGSIDAAIAAVRPDIVVNAAAYTAVDKAENEPDAAFAINRDGAGKVAAAAADAGLPVIHLSTDYVFSGERTQPYREDDATGPTGVYGASKLAGEAAVAAANRRHVILRTAWIYSPFGKNFVKTMLRLAGERDVVRVVADQIGTPTHAGDIAEGIVAVAGRLVGDGAPAGLYHMVAQGEASWADLAEAVFAASCRRGGPSAAVERIGTAAYPTPAKRPANSRLDTHRFTAAFDHRLPHWTDGVERCVASILAT